MEKCNLCGCLNNSAHRKGGGHYATENRHKMEIQGYKVYYLPSNTRNKLIQSGVGKNLSCAFWNSGGINRRGYFSPGFLLKKDRDLSTLLTKYRIRWGKERLAKKKQVLLEKKRAERKFLVENKKALKILQYFQVQVPEEIKNKVDCAIGEVVTSPEHTPQQAIQIRKETDEYLIWDEKGYFLLRKWNPHDSLQNSLNRLIPQERRNTHPELKHLWKRQGEFHFFPAIISRPEGYEQYLTDYPLRRSSRHIGTGWFYLSSWGEPIAFQGKVIAPDHRDMELDEIHYIFVNRQAAD